MPEKQTKLSAGVVVVSRAGADWEYLLLRAYNNWDFPKGMVEAAEAPLAAAMREVREETLIENLAFDWGEDFIETGPYSRGKVARYYLAETPTRQVSLPHVEALGRAEHNEFRWVSFEAAKQLISVRLNPVLQWADAKLHRRALKAARRFSRESS